ncbi:MAG: division/cell wall cluster transcriptional repressor MraZ [Gaiellaceae bacterium]
MLLGEFDHTIDDKNRVTLPARFRETFAEGAVMTRGMDGCLSVYPRGVWERLAEERLGGLDTLTPEGRRLERYFYSAAAEVDLDRQGRMVIPGRLSRYAELGKDVVVAGLRDRVEIWDRDAWGRERDDIEGSAEHVAERIAGRRD